MLCGFSLRRKKAKRHAQLEKITHTPSPEPLLGSLSPLPQNGNVFQPISPPSPARVGPPPSPPVPTSPIAPVAPQPAGPLPLLPCAVCSRTFVPESLAKHVKICERTALKKRKTFDSSRQRREGTDLEQYLPKNFGLPENSPFLEKSPPNTAKTLPRQKSQSTRAPITKTSAELQKCPHCNRAFGVRAFERHVEWCADKAKLLPTAPTQPPPHIADAKQRLNARTQYKAPSVRGRRSSQSRDKSSNSRSASVDSSRGVSPPPPPPREYGDYKRGRTRASVSESVSSNEFHEEAPVHVPVIRNSRGAVVNNSGDAVKARQARLARDLSNSRSNHPTTSSTQEISNPINLESKPKILTVKKINTLKKLDAITQKYKDNPKSPCKKTDSRNQLKTNPKDRINVKSAIPIPKEVPNKKIEKRMFNRRSVAGCSKDEQVIINPKKTKRVMPPKIPSNNSLSSDSLETCKDFKNLRVAPVKLNKPQSSRKVKKPIDRNIKEFYLNKADSSENCSNDNTHSIGINTELLCPCVPCVIHEDAKTKLNRIKNETNIDKNVNSSSKDKIELLYQNPTVHNTLDVKTIQIIYDEDIDTKSYNCEQPSSTHLEDSDINFTCKSNSPKYESIDSLQNDINLEEEKFEDSLHEDYPYKNEDCELSNVDHHSGDTYTKFTEDVNNLEEFMNITDQLISNQIDAEPDDMCLGLHTPNTSSIETACFKDFEVSVPDTVNRILPDVLSRVKEKLTEVIMDEKVDNVTQETKQEIMPNINIDRQVSDMEHVTVYQIKNKVQDIPKNNVFEFSLPSISENNKSVSSAHHSRKKVDRMYNANRKNNMMRELKKSNANFKTFIRKDNVDDSASDGHSITSEAPPLKLPRIENTRKRLDDSSYDPFLSAARQMKELMSSDTNIPKKMQSTPKDPTRTLPMLRGNKEKSPPNYARTDNTKMIKETLNKSYQKTPTLQRMKSFGSTHNEINTSFGGRCSSFRLNRNDNKKSNPKLNSTFTKSSKENISVAEKTTFNRNSSLNRSFSNYSTSSYSTPKPRDKMPKISTSMYHSFQRSTIKQPVKLDKIKKEDNKKHEFVNLDSILTDDNSSLADSNYIDPRLINENDNLPINVNTIRNNPDIISSMESLQTTENLPAKFESFTKNNHMSSSYEYNVNNKSHTLDISKKSAAPSTDDLSAQYDKIMTSLEQSIASKASVRDDDSLCEDFDLEEFITSFDEELHKQMSENKRTCSSTTRIVKHAIVDNIDCNIVSDVTSDSSLPKVISNKDNEPLPYTINKSNSLNFSNNNIATETLFPTPMKRSNSNILDSQQKRRNSHKDEKGDRHRNHKVEQLEQDIMQSLKDFDKFCDVEKSDNPTKKHVLNHIYNGNTLKRETPAKPDRKSKKHNDTNGNATPNGKHCNDSAYSSLNRISPSKLSLCPDKPNELVSLDQIPAGSDSGGSHRENELQSVSSEEFLAMERSTELDAPLRKGSHERLTNYQKEVDTYKIEEKRTSSRASSRKTTPLWQSRQELSSSGSESSLHRSNKSTLTLPQRLSRFCHECGSKFPVDTAKFCIECGVKRLVV